MKLDNAKIRGTSSDLEPKEKSQRRISLLQEKFRDEITYLGIDQLVAFRHQAREVFDDESLVSLSQTIKQHGVRQPLTVLSRQDDKYEIVSGERRYRAAIMAGLTRVPCMVIHDQKQAEEIALIENVQRTDLTMLELGRALAGLIEREIFVNHSEMADQLGLPRTKVVECINLTKLREDVQNLIHKNNIVSRDLLREIVALKEPEKQIEYVVSKFNSVLSNQNKTKNRVSKGSGSVIRVSLQGHGFTIQKRGLTRMGIEHKQELKEILMSLIEEL
jgi:ParB family transcriptional regulator, chromosome partitioning protein